MKKSSWQTTLIGVLMAGVAVFQTMQAPSWKAAATDPKIQIALLGAVLGKLSKDASNA